MNLRFEIYTVAFILLSALLFIKCSGLNDPKENVEIVKQIDIPWPSLAGTPWPMYHHDPQSTGRSKFRGPQQGLLSEKKYIGMVATGGVLTNNKTFCIGTFSTIPNYYSFDHNFNEINHSSIPNYIYTNPIIRSDGMIYVFTEKSINVIKNDNNISLEQPFEDGERLVGISANIDQKGNLYYIDFNHNLTSRDKNGNLNWKINNTMFLNTEHCSPSFSNDGNTLYMQGTNVSLIAFDIYQKTIKWTFGNQSLLSAPVIDNNGNIYIVPENEKPLTKRIFYSINKNGNINWQYEFHSDIYNDNTEPTIDYDGNIYFGADTLYSVTNSGKFRWKKALDGNVSTSLICDNQNTVYVFTHTQKNKSNIYAISQEGNIKWQIPILEAGVIGIAPSISEDGFIVFPIWNSNIYSFYIII